MKEVVFIRRNIERWRAGESAVEQAHRLSPDELAQIYLELTADLAFAQTHYPQARITLYLNRLTAALHRAVFRNRREGWGRVLSFWTDEVPLAVYDARKALGLSLLIFVLGMCVGVISTLSDESFPRLILGDRYVDTTLQNIAAGKPMAIYASGGEYLMFLQITLNNIMVAFRCFAMGVFTSIGTGYILWQNGIMLGAFETFFFREGLLWESVLAVWLHGTLEISSIVVAGGAGIVLGNGWLFPGSYTRLVSFRQAAKRGVKILVGTVPLFVIAGFIESFLTRHTHYPTAVRLGLILCSLAFILYYYLYLPYRKFYGTYYASHRPAV